MKVDSMMHQMTYADTEGDDDIDVQLDPHGSGGHLHNSKADIRKSNKPIMEKRRRARINNCLNDLKGILLEAMRKDPARHSKLEKADILELTVRHLQNVQRNQLAIAMATDPTVLHRFKNGFSECATEVSRYLGRLDGADPGIRQRLTGHLGACVSGLHQVGPMTFGAPRYSPLGGGMPFAQSPATTPNTLGLHPAPPSAAGMISPQTTMPPMGDINNNRYNSGHTPASATVTSSTFQNASRLGSAFTTVPRRPPTPPPSPSLSPPSSSFHGNDTQNISIGSDSSISMISICESNEKGTNTTPNLSLSGGGVPIDFSLHKAKKDESSSGSSSRGEKDRSHQVRVVKVEPMPSSMMMTDTNPNSKDNMWRPW